MEHLETRSLLLRHIVEEDFFVLHSWRNLETFRHFCSTRRGFVSLEQFREELNNDLKRDRHRQLIALRKKNTSPVGTMWTYNMNLTDGYVFITTFVEPNYERFGYGVEMFAATMYSLFNTFSQLNKIYTEVYSYNNHSLNIMKRFGFSEEGVFLEHRLLNGTRYNLHRLAFYRTDFLSKLDFVSKLLSNHGDAQDLQTLND